MWRSLKDQKAAITSVHLLTKKFNCISNLKYKHHQMRLKMKKDLSLRYSRMRSYQVDMKEPIL